MLAEPRVLFANHTVPLAGLADVLADKRLARLGRGERRACGRRCPSVGCLETCHTARFEPFRLLWRNRKHAGFDLWLLQAWRLFVKESPGIKRSRNNHVPSSLRAQPLPNSKASPRRKGSIRPNISLTLIGPISGLRVADNRRNGHEERAALLAALSKLSRCVDL